MTPMTKLAMQSCPRPWSSSSRTRRSRPRFLDSAPARCRIVATATAGPPSATRAANRTTGLRNSGSRACTSTSVVRQHKASRRVFSSTTKKTQLKRKKKNMVKKMFIYMKACASSTDMRLRLLLLRDQFVFYCKRFSFHLTTVLFLDYICTDADLALIDWIKEIPCEPRVEVVLIDDACVERKWIECLFQPGAYLGDEVIDCYINLIKTTQQLKCRSRGRVHIENAFQFNFLKRDGDVKTKTDELYPITDMAQICSAERRVLLYLDHDMVFIPINIRGTHWYLAVINARNMEIQVLDSLGTTFDRNDLTDSIKGLQRQIDMVSQRKDLKDHRWPNLQVASWPLREIDMGYAKQTDGSSCGLFLLNYIEYWTGDELSDSFTQDDMSHFRKKLAAILLSSYMNKRRGYPIYKYDKEVHTGSPSDVEILDSPTNHKKRKLLHVLDNSEVLMEDEDGPIT
ncbi:hypothetical protein ZEAMMB73_Zm00001d004065 [Zea mays]|uniref:Ubiquitin-like protease family profile domain-containing protein n=1 Tax=Zea mays TaxID=4577 RepID=A0A1D6ED97_MAIZE|nr:hypothetical protein ZEAMMB73_Zm00001d004065 [Zea mays]